MYSLKSFSLLIPYPKERCTCATFSPSLTYDRRKTRIKLIRRIHVNANKLSHFLLRYFRLTPIQNIVTGSFGKHEALGQGITERDERKVMEGKCEEQREGKRWKRKRKNWRRNEKEGKEKKRGEKVRKAARASARFRALTHNYEMLGIH